MICLIHRAGSDPDCVMKTSWVFECIGSISHHLMTVWSQRRHSMLKRNILAARLKYLFVCTNIFLHKKLLQLLCTIVPLVGTCICLVFQLLSDSRSSVIPPSLPFCDFLQKHVVFIGPQSRSRSKDALQLCRNSCVALISDCKSLLTCKSNQKIWREKKVSLFPWKWNLSQTIVDSSRRISFTFFPLGLISFSGLSCGFVPVQEVGWWGGHRKRPPPSPTTTTLLLL